MAESVRIEAVTLAELRGEQGALYGRWEDPYGLARMTEEKRRAVLTNPCAGGDGRVVQLLAVKGAPGGAVRDRVVGRLDLIGGEVAADGKVAPVVWGSDWSVPEQERGSMAALVLLMQMQRLTPAGGMIGAHGPSAAATPVYQKMKWVDFPMRRLILLRKGRSVVERYVGRGAKGAVARAGVGAALGVHAAGLGAVAAMVTRGLRVREVREMPAAWDGLVRGGGAGEAAGVARAHRSAAFLNWWMGNAFFPASGGRARNRNALLLVETSRGEAAGYVAMKVRFHEFATHRRLPNLLLGSIQDWMVFPGGAPGTAPGTAPGARGRASWLALFLLAARALSRMGVDAVDLCIDDSHGEGARAAKALGRLGWLGVGEFHALWKPAAGGVLSEERFKRSENWRLRPGDGDTFFA